MSEWLAPQQSLPGQDHTGGHTVWVRPERLLEMARRQFSDCGHVDFLWLMMCTTMFNILFYWVVLSNLVQRSVHGCIYVIKGIAIGGHWCPLNHTQWVLKSSFTQKVTYRIKKKKKKRTRTVYTHKCSYLTLVSSSEGNLVWNWHTVPLV